MNLDELNEELIRLHCEIQEAEFAIDMLGPIGIDNEYAYLDSNLECLEMEMDDIERKIRDFEVYEE